MVPRPRRSRRCWSRRSVGRVGREFGRAGRSARLDSARLGSARLGSTRLGSTWFDSARLSSARLGSARLVLARLKNSQKGLGWYRGHVGRAVVGQGGRSGRSVGKVGREGRSGRSNRPWYVLRSPFEVLCFNFKKIIDECGLRGLDSSKKLSNVRSRMNERATKILIGNKSAHVYG